MSRLLLAVGRGLVTFAETLLDTPAPAYPPLPPATEQEPPR